ncbi:GNAT family N-acetyltransferase [Streptococcus equinus]|uniref:Acetyltransferase, GNAT family n=1 Tax=Streptococcus equinus ATCC 9812 TaxID=525379 RepID=E8JMQ3_STREI|nr:GNAT family N-acetyltransferase [Streptococcus equinus]EFW89668.1 acetyltransferase, GNAT family [Streptococcus equinus ATCC 9812]SUN56705.1 GNAT family acetyltransferase [Streptococcus equinus]
MTIRRAKEADIPKLIDLLEQVLLVHHKVRPDLFQEKGVKYTESELAELIADDSRPIFVYEDESGTVLGHLFTVIEESHAPKVAHKTLFIDDLCVDEAARGQKIGEQLYRFALQYAKEIGCYNLTLNVWSANKSAVRFYERQGLTPQETRMEQIID